MLSGTVASHATYNGERSEAPLKFFDIGQEAHGFIAIGQFASGVFVVGQVAVGFVAIGQGAVGVIAIGQGAVGLVSVGMGAVGIYWTLAMVGIGGSGMGLVVKLAPSLGPVPELPPTTEWSAARPGDWVETAVGANTPSRLELPDGTRVDARLRRALERAEPGPVLVHLADSGPGRVVDEVMRVPAPRYTKPGWWLVWLIQLGGLVVLCGMYVGLFVLPWLRLLGVWP